ncbi:MAG: insulinase family protein [Bacteroidota bacterium]
MRTAFRLVLTVVALLVAAGYTPRAVVAQPVEANAVAEDAPQLAGPTPEAEGVPLPLRNDLVADTLDNGLMYYILPHSGSQNRAELRLVVNAGSILEDDDQRGVARFIERMAFNGTAQFEGQEIRDVLEGIGVRIGSDQIASTSFDETFYRLTVPTDSAAIVETAFDLLREWASAIALDPEAVEKERRLILEGESPSEDVYERVLLQQRPVLYNGSRYADRPPTSNPEAIRTVSVEAIERFYADWYRPDLMTVIAVGDFDPADIEAKIRARFASLDNPADAPERVYYGVPDNDGLQVSISTDPEHPNSYVGVFYRQPNQPTGTDVAFRRDLETSLFDKMFSQRFLEFLLRSDKRLRWGNWFEGDLVRTRDVQRLHSIVPEGGIEVGLRLLLTEVARVRQHGFTEREINLAKSMILADSEQAAHEADTEPLVNLASELMRHALEGEPVLHPETELALVTELLQGIGPADMEAKAAALRMDANATLVVRMPEKEGVAVPDEAALASIFDEVAALDVGLVDDVVAEAPLIPMLPPPGTVVSETAYPALDYAEFTLDNGVRVVHKQTDFENDEVLVRAFSPGGYGLAPDSLYPSAQVAATLKSESGFGELTASTLERKLAGQVVTVKPFISEWQEGFEGSARPDDLETLFQLVHLYGSYPYIGDTVVRAYRQRARGLLQDRAESLQAVFEDTLQMALMQNHPRRQFFAAAALDAIDDQYARVFYNNRFVDFDDFTFVVVGSVPLDTVQVFAERYLGNMYTLPRTDAPVIAQTPPPSGVVEKVIVAGDEPHSRVALVYTGLLDLEDRAAMRADILRFEAMGEVLGTRLREDLREAHSGVHGVGVSTSVDREAGEYALRIDFECDPARVDDLVGAVKAEVAALRSAPPAATYLARVKEQTRRAHEENVRENGYWLSVLEAAYRYDEPPETLLASTDRTLALTLDDIQIAAQRFLDPTQLVQVALVPETFEGE